MAKLTPANLFRLMTEMIFVLLGGFLVWFGWAHPFRFHPPRPAWQLLGAVVLVWGIQGLWRTMHTARTIDRTANQVAGVSLIIVGLLMLALVYAEFLWVGTILSITGGVLVARGLAGAVLAVWPE
jgi:hypothetical protein